MRVACEAVLSLPALDLSVMTLYLRLCVFPFPPGPGFGSGFAGRNLSSCVCCLGMSEDLFSTLGLCVCVSQLRMWMSLCADLHFCLACGLRTRCSQQSTLFPFSVWSSTSLFPFFFFSGEGGVPSHSFLGLHLFLSCSFGGFFPELSFRLSAKPFE